MKGWPPLGRKVEYVCSTAFFIAEDSTERWLMNRRMVAFLTW